METYNGHVRTPADAIILFEACRLGLLPRVQRRLSEKERQSIKSGSVFVWDEREAGMRRWTDGKSWSASRVSGSFLTYREMEGKRGGNAVSQSSASRAGKTPESVRGSDEDHGEGGEEGPDGYRYKPDGLMKQSFSITTSTGQHLHLISYYARSHPTAANLNQPTTDPALRHIRPQKGMYPESTVSDQQNMPVVTRGPMPGSPYTLSPHPHPAAYPRPGPAHPQSYGPGQFGWPPTPNVQMGQYGPSYMPLAPGNHGPHHGPYNQQPPIPSLQSPNHNYERPSHTPESSLPPPMQPSPSSNRGPPYANNRSPRSSQSKLSDHHGRVSPGHPQGPQLSQIDPRIMSPRGRLQPGHSNGGSPGQGHSPTPQRMSSDHLQPYHNVPNHKENPGSSPNTVPGIGALMNGASAPPITGSYAAPTSNPGHEHLPGEHKQNGSRGDTRSPHNGNSSGEGPKDIPSEKIGFGEDMRALRQLDRVFTA
ncbi:hypothetical protein FQN54_009375 [Arachnomyces sp. PD_36]|nr:hypothetical protein FQN54_009375 [Arachnomyces sp. PD_36]